MRDLFVSYNWKQQEHGIVAVGCCVIPAAQIPERIQSIEDLKLLQEVIKQVEGADEVSIITFRRMED